MGRKKDVPETIIFCMAIILARMLWIHRRDRHLADIRYGSPEECRQAEEWAAVVRENMEQKGLAEYLMKDYQYTELLTPEDLNNEQLLQAKMTRMMRDLHRYLHLAPGCTLRVRFDRDHSMARAGQINYARRIIDIFPRNEYTAETLMAVLAHETAHYFLYQNGIGDPDIGLNERYTDTAACLIGLSSYMLEGNVGYLKKRQFIAVRNSLYAYRNRHA